ncbi:MAG: lysophospholipid acyltransferase family protein [Cyclobacteriaceae bacterium]|nr:lysophospholipid acyltransferase family protein [Cyclobacteriaceae bacterium]
MRKNQNDNAAHLLSAVVYCISLPFIYSLSALPFKVLYLFSDFFYVLMFHFIGYRKTVVLQNLKKSFPEKTNQQINKICKHFYHNLCDFILEITKAITMSKKSLQQRCRFDPETGALLSRLADANKSVILVMGHIGNWEWACNAFNLSVKHQLYVIYHPVTNKYFDRLMYRIRTRNETKLIAMQNTYREMALHKNELNVTVFVADQTPRPDNAYWTTFLNQDSPVFKGMEVIAKKMNLPVLYASVNKVKRGFYEMHCEVLAEVPAKTSEGELSEMYIRRLEKDIVAQPENWLWSHRRWKHKRSRIELS